MAVKQKQYDNYKAQIEGIARRQGLNPQNVVIDYAGGGTTSSGVDFKVEKPSILEVLKSGYQGMTSSGLNYTIE